MYQELHLRATPKPYLLTYTHSCILCTKHTTFSSLPPPFYDCDAMSATSQLHASCITS